jgi:hypothetical protein
LKSAVIADAPWAFLSHLLADGLRYSFSSDKPCPSVVDAVQARRLLPEIERQQRMGKEVVFRGDAAFAKPEIYEALEERCVE